jgi:hypothetical protein
MTNRTALTLNAQPIKLTLPEIGDLFVVMHSTMLRCSIKTSPQAGLMVDGLLYQFNAQAVKHASGWALEHESIMLKGVQGKRRQTLLAKITFALNGAMEENPDFEESMKLRAWLEEYSQLRRDMRRDELNLEYVNRELARAQRNVTVAEETLVRTVQRLGEHVDAKPEGVDLPEDED